MALLFILAAGFGAHAFRELEGPLSNVMAAADAVARLDVGDERDQRRDLLVREIAIAEFVARIDDLDADTGTVDVADTTPARLASVPCAFFLVDEAIGRLDPADATPD